VELHRKKGNSTDFENKFRTAADRIYVELFFYRQQGTVDQLQVNYLKLRSSENNYLAYQDMQSIVEVRTFVALLKDEFATSGQFDSVTRTEMLTQVDAYLQAFDGLVELDKQISTYNEEMINARSAVEASAAKIETLGNQLGADGIKTAQSNSAQTYANTIIVVIAVLILTILISIMLSQQITRPIRALTNTVQEISLGNLDVQAGVSSGDEVGALAQTFNTMTAQLRQTLADLSTRTKDIATVAEVGSATASVMETKKLLQTVVDLTKERLNLYHSQIYLLDEEGKQLVLAAGAGELGPIMAGKHSIPLKREHSLVARVAREREVVIVNDVRQSPDFLPNPLLPNTRSELAVPMIAGGEVIGVFDVQDESATMTQNIDQVIVQGMVAASLHIWDPEAATPFVQAALDKGIIMTSFFSPLGKTGIPTARSDEKGISFAMGAEMAAQWKAAHPNKPIVMVELGWPNHTEVKSGRTDPFVEGVKSVDPSATNLGCQDASKGPDAARQIITDLMISHPEVNLIYSEASNLTVGTMSALRQSGRGKFADGKPLTEIVASVDFDEVEMKEVYDPNSSLKLSMGLPPVETARGRIDLIMNVASGKVKPISQPAEEFFYKAYNISFWTMPRADAAKWLNDQFGTHALSLEAAKAPTVKSVRKIAFFVSDLSVAFHQAQAAEAKKYAREKYGAEVIVFDGKSDQGGRFTESDINILVSLAAQVSTSVQNLRSIEAQMWLATGQTQLADVMRGDQDMLLLAENVISQLCRYMGAQAGALFLLNEKKLTLIGQYAFTIRSDFEGDFMLGDGLVGQAALDGKLFHLDDIPPETLVISTGLVDVKPREVIAAPFYANGAVVGVIELVTLHRFAQSHFEFLRRISESVGVAFRTAETRRRLAELLAESQSQAEELQAQEEELRAVNEELHAQAENLRNTRDIRE